MSAGTEWVTALAVGLLLCAFVRAVFGVADSSYVEYVSAPRRRRRAPRRARRPAAAAPRGAVAPDRGVMLLPQERKLDRRVALQLRRGLLPHQDVYVVGAHVDRGGRLMWYRVRDRRSGAAVDFDAWRER